MLDGKTEVTSMVADHADLVNLAIPKSKLWSPDDPFLYDLEVTLLDGEKVIELHDCLAFGISIEIRKGAWF